MIHAMNLIWASTIVANLILLGVLIPQRKRFPILFGSQCLVVAFSALLLWGYYSPSVDQESYRNAWLATDQLSVLMATFSAWELWEKCFNNRTLCFGAVVWIAHAGLMCWEYRGDVYGATSAFRVDANIVLTLAIALMLYCEQKGESMTTKKKPTIKPMDTGTGSPPTKPPPTKTTPPGGTS